MPSDKAKSSSDDGGGSGSNSGCAGLMNPMGMMGGGMNPMAMMGGGMGMMPGMTPSASPSSGPELVMQALQDFPSDLAADPRGFLLRCAVPGQLAGALQGEGGAGVKEVQDFTSAT